MNSWEINPDKTSCEFQENLEILRVIPFFAKLPLETLKVMAYLCIRETFKKGQFLFTQDDDDGQAFYIISGNAELLYAGESGEHRIRGYGEGGFLGGLTLLGRMRRLFSLVALTDVTCLILTRKKFARSLEQSPELMPTIVGAAVERIRSWEERFLLSCDKSCTDYKEKIGVSLE
jgi:CRP/FNR family transcriptional regulator, cyclic AMP receptor protein